MQNQMTNDQIQAAALAAGFTLKPQPDGGMALHPHMFEFGRAMFAAGQRAADEEIARLRNALADAKSVANQAMAELSSLTIAQQACIGCTGDGYDSFGMRCSGPPPIEASKNQPTGRECHVCKGAGSIGVRRPARCRHCGGTGKELV